MGMFDTVKVPCPKCSGHAFVQSKTGWCDLTTYNYADCPDDVRAGIVNEPCVCELGHKFVVRMATEIQSVREWPKDVDTSLVWDHNW